MEGVKIAFKTTMERQMILDNIAEKKGCTRTDVINNAIDVYVGKTDNFISKELFITIVELYKYIDMIEDKQLKTCILEKMGGITCLL